MFIVIQGTQDQREGETMALDSAAGHRRTYDLLTAFMASRDPSIEITARGTCPLCPDCLTLRAFRMVKTSGRVMTTETADGALQVSGRADLLARYIEAFGFEPGEEGHRHPDHAILGELVPGTAMVIVEADEEADDPAGRDTQPS